MRSIEPMPENPWPHDMTLRIQDSPRALLELLWVREAHGLAPPDDDPPPKLVDTPSPATGPRVSAATRMEWESSWSQLWRDVVAHVGLDVDQRAFDRLQGTADASPERAELLRSIVGPSWRDRFGDTAFDDRSYREWQDRDRPDPRPRRLEDTPERRDLDALIPAWRAGLTTVVTIPCVSAYARRVGNVLVTTNAVRRSSDSYRRALSVFR